jgi:hypothetical protein
LGVAQIGVDFKQAFVNGRPGQKIRSPVNKRGRIEEMFAANLAEAVHGCRHINHSLRHRGVVGRAHPPLHRKRGLLLAQGLHVLAQVTEHDRDIPHRCCDAL